MPLPAPDYPRSPMHNRYIRAHSFERDDGLWDIDAELIDTKSYDFERRDGSTRHAGEPFHHMHIRITFDKAFNVVAAVAAYDAAPYGEICTCIAPDYSNLVGMNLLKGFRQAVKVRFARAAGCSHMTELAGLLPTVALQTRASFRSTEPAQDPGKKPFQVDGCHALSQHGPVVREFHPEWYVPLKRESEAESSSS
ncbi:DUF2889 domain-containing protein [Orrella marina]|uniref:DUF2889 domain-containing protein n=1 Tax=Orrella marina TaxID=2163011 RepID=A0A2R4XGE7_9BURK|nr:DUF2889 domain-containing protein [Orrella marina]AWB32877.1 hypothetical protein DBV39_03140 [Orrella marina]